MKDFEFTKKKLMTPGPVPLADYVKASLAEMECHHRTKEFVAIQNEVFEQLKKIFQTEQHCYMLACTGSGAMEAAVVNTLGTRDSLLFINAGKFGERWGKIAKAYKIPSQEIQFPWGKDIDLERVKKELATGKHTALAFQACETSSGALLPVKELAQLCRENNVLSIVDGITALGAVDLPMDAWGIDVMVGGSQKAFMLPTGMAFISLSQKAEKRESDIPCYYFNLKAEKKSNLDGKTRFSTPTHFILALNMVLDEILNKVGLKKHFQQIHDKAEYFREQVGLDLFPETSSPSLSCLKLPVGTTAKKIKSKVAEDGYIIMGGQDDMAELVLRVGHMGAISREDLKQTAESIKRHLA